MIKTLRGMDVVVSHSIIENLFYCASSPNGMTNDFMKATRFPNGEAVIKHFREKYGRDMFKFAIFTYVER